MESSGWTVIIAHRAERWGRGRVGRRKKTQVGRRQREGEGVEMVLNVDKEGARKKVDVAVKHRFSLCDH